MGLLFQPRWTSNRPGHVAPAVSGDLPFDRGMVFGAALEAVLIGDASRFADLFTEDVVFSSPHLVIESLAAVQRALGSPEDSLSDIVLVLLNLDAIEDRVMAEWRLDARFTRAVSARRPPPARADGWRRAPPRGVVRRVPGAPDPVVPALLRRQRAARRASRAPQPPALAVRPLTAADDVDVDRPDRASPDRRGRAGQRRSSTGRTARRRSARVVRRPGPASGNAQWTRPGSMCSRAWYQSASAGPSRPLRSKLRRRRVVSAARRRGERRLVRDRAEDGVRDAQPAVADGVGDRRRRRRRTATTAASPTRARQ